MNRKKLKKFFKEVTYHTPAGDYTCTGGLIKACGGSKEVADYLGV